MRGTPSGPVRGPLGGWERLVDRAGATIRAEVGPAGIEIVLEDPNHRGVTRTRIPYPRAGHGGHELLLSAGERYLAMFLYSGQSEVGYELFSYPDLRWVCALPYVFGEGLGPAFSPDERRLALAWATNPSLDRTDAVGVGDEAVTTTGCVVDWACLHVRTLPAADRASGGGSDGGEPKGSPPGDEVCALRVRVSPGDPVEGNESYYPEDLRFHDTDVIGFRTAWGEDVRLALPLPTSVTVPGPRA